MNIKFSTLTLQCRQGIEVIRFSPQISFFHGQISAGKSSIARLIDFCLGGNLEWTPALSQELVSVKLSVRIRESDVEFTRDAEESHQVNVSWQNMDKGSSRRSVLAPIETSSDSPPVWSDNIFNLSDLIFYFLGITPIKVRRSKTDPNSSLVRLSFRDIIWYCYLEQDHLDSEFFWLKNSFRKFKSRDVMGFLVGFYSERLSELEILLDDIKLQRTDKLETAKKIRTFLQEFGYASELEISNQIGSTQIELRNAYTEESLLREYPTEGTHFADELRNRLRGLEKELANEEQTLWDMNERIAEQEALRAELLSTKSKLARAESASSILSGVTFESCPSCGRSLNNNFEVDRCRLCGRHTTDLDRSGESDDLMRKDLTSRIDELDDSIERHKKARKKQENSVNQVKQNKKALDRRLTEELANYDSAFLSRSRELERRIAMIEERIQYLNNILKMPKALAELEKEADELVAKELQVQRQILQEKGGLTSADQYIQKIEEEFLHSLLKVGVPGVRIGDRVEINRTTWIPSITSSDEETRYDFYNAGSGGKKTLLNVCYALAIHKVASENNLPLPTFLIIDTPMKNIGEEVNEDIFVSFYKYLYDLASSSLTDTQFIIIDKGYIPPETDNINVFERYMAPNHNPLIPYYRGA